MMASRVVPFIVEGSTDADCLVDLLATVVERDADLREVVAGGDVTLARIHPDGMPGLNSADPFAAVRRLVMDDMDRWHEYRPSDVAAVIQATDLDGCMIPDDHVVEEDSLVYHADRIGTPHVDGIRRRNHVKAESLLRLSRSGATIVLRGRRVPYFLYYLSRNLEHALHGDDRGLTARQKTRRALEFQRRYRDPKTFMELLSSDDVLHGYSDYAESWRWPESGDNSLFRGSNIALMPDMIADTARKQRNGAGKNPR